MRHLAPALLVTALACVGAALVPVVHGQEAAEPAKPAEREKTPAEIMMEQSRPGPEHRRLAELAGAWTVEKRSMGRPQAAEGTATVTSLLGNRFFDVDVRLGADAAAQQLRFTLGFDRRHGEHTITLIDTAGTYAVTARGNAQDGRIRMVGSDDDPYMRSLGLEEAFVFDLLTGDDGFEIVLHFVDTRKEDRPLMEATRYVFRR